MLNKLLKFLPHIIILVSLYNVYSGYENHQVTMEEKSATIPIIENNIRKAKKDQKDLAIYLEDVEKAKARIEKAADEIENLQKKLPDNISDPEILVTIKGAADKLNIKNITLSPQEEKNNGFYFSKTYLLKGTGTYLQFLIFLEKVGENQRILNVRSVQFANLKEEQRGRVQLINGTIVIEVYRHNPQFKEDRSIQGAVGVKKG